jgi:hypothetical protein
VYVYNAANNSRGHISTHNPIMSIHTVCRKKKRSQSTAPLRELLTGFKGTNTLRGDATKVAKTNRRKTIKMYARRATQCLSSRFVSALLFCIVLWTHAAEANVNAARVGHAAESNVNAARVGHALHLRNGELTFEDKSKWYEPEGRGVAYLPSCNLRLHSLVCEKEKTKCMHGSASCHNIYQAYSCPLVCRSKVVKVLVTYCGG